MNRRALLGLIAGLPFALKGVREVVTLPSRNVRQAFRAGARAEEAFEPVVEYLAPFRITATEIAMRRWLGGEMVLRAPGEPFFGKAAIELMEPKPLTSPHSPAQPLGDGEGRDERGS